MNNYRGLFIGLTTIDIQYFVEEFPAPNIKVKTEAPEILVGGPATNAAVSFAQLNNSAFLATPFGNNSFLSFVNKDFVNTGVTHVDLVKGQDVNPVIASVVTTKSSGDRNVFTNNPKKISSIISASQLFTKVNPDIILLDGFYPEFSLACAKLAKQKEIPVVIDCGSWKPQYNELLKHADIAICSADFYPPNCINSAQVFNYVKSLGVKQIAITRGDKNILHQNNNNSFEISIRKAKVADTLGAGDFLHGAFCYYYLQEKETKTALMRASEMATFSCQYKGTREWLKFWK